jgi:hypothetical protein
MVLGYMYLALRWLSCWTQRPLRAKYITLSLFGDVEAVMSRGVRIVVARKEREKEKAMSALVGSSSEPRWPGRKKD